MQGEADAGSGWASVYEKSFLGLLDQIKTDLKIKKINFVIGRINDYWLPEYGTVDGEVMRKLQVKIGEEHENGDWVNTDDLNTGINPWGIFEVDGGHFPDAAYHVMGQRFARKACKLINPDITLDPKVFTEQYIASASQISSHLALGKPVSGSTPDAKHKGSDAGLSDLVDGKYGSADQHDKAWLGFAPTEKGIEFLIDLGESQLVTGIAANILFNPNASAHFPENMLIEISEDGKNFSSFSRRGAYRFFYDKKQAQMMTKNLKPQPFLIHADFTIKNARIKDKKARYIKVTVKSGTSWFFIDEIVVNPVMKK